MAKTYTEEQLNTFDKATLIQLLLMQQSQLQEIDNEHPVPVPGKKV